MKRKGKLPFDPKVFLSKVNGGRAIHDYRKDQIVFRQGDPADAVFYIQSGKVKKTVVSEQGQGSRGRTSGNRRFLRRRMFDRTAAASGNGLRYDEMRDCANIKGRHHSRDSTKSRRLPSYLSRTSWLATVVLRRTWSINCSIRARNGWHGFFCFWRILARKARPEPIIAKISQETLAEMIGTTRSRVSFFMNKFRKLGLIDYNGQHRSPQFAVERGSARSTAD